MCHRYSKVGKDKLLKLVVEKLNMDMQKNTVGLLVHILYEKQLKMWQYN